MFCGARVNYLEALSAGSTNVGSSTLIEEVLVQACFGWPIRTLGAFLLVDCLNFANSIGSVFASMNQNESRKKGKERRKGGEKQKKD